MLPSIPRKSNQLCHDVQPTLRDIFQNPYFTLPPMVYKSGIRQTGSEENISKTEENIVSTRERQLTAQRRTNCYKLAELNLPIMRVVEEHRTSKLLTSDDLLPPVELKLCHTTLWVKNILAATKHQDSGSNDSLMYPVHAVQSRMSTPPQINSQSLSMVNIESSARALCRRSATPPAPVGAAPAHLLRAVPPQVDFVNCRVGQTYTITMRLVNVSKYSTRFSIVPPRRSELAVQLSCAYAGGGARYAGGATLVHVRFTPRDVREVHDQMRVHVGGGATEIVKIQCYMEAPVLNISLLDEDNAELYSHANTPVHTVEVMESSDSETSYARAERESSDTLDLGAMLLGGLRRVDTTLHCNSRHAAFFLLTEEAWLGWNIHNITRSGALLADPFVVRPTYFSGGGVIPGTIWCTPDSPGLHVRSLRILASTAVVRELYLLVDAVHFQSELIRILAEEKNFDICEDEDTRCQYYLNLGTAFPGRRLSKTFGIVNDSPVAYVYYWIARPWGVCLCRPGSSVGLDEGQSSDIVVQPSHGRIAAQSTCSATVTLPNAARGCGTHRAILMLVLRNIPRESFPNGYNPIIVSRRMIVGECVPGVPDYSYETCDVVCASVEVWWQIEPVRVMLQPCKLRLPHTYWTTEVQVECTITQLTSADGITCKWLPASDAALIVPKGAFVASLSHSAQIQVLLAPQPPSSAVIQVVAEEGDFTTSLVVERLPIRRTAEISPSHVWCNVLPPLETYQTTLTVRNERDQQVACSVSTHRDSWLCCECPERACACAIVTPLNARVEPQRTHDVIYTDTTSKARGAELTLLQLVDRVCGALPGQCSLVAVYSQPPVVALHLLTGLDHADSKLEDICELEASSSCVARPSRAVTLGLPMRFSVRLSNYAPVEANFAWERPLDPNDPLDITFCPKEGVIKGHDHIDVQVTVCGKRVCRRRVCVRSCCVSARGSAPAADTRTAPVYLLVDAAVTGVSISLDIPTGVDGSKSVRVFRYLRSNLENDEEYVSKQLDFKAAIVEQSVPTMIDECVADNYSAPAISASAAPAASASAAPAASTSAAFAALAAAASAASSASASAASAAAASAASSAAFAPSEVPCIQFVSIPLRTVRERTVRLQNESLLPARWSARPTLFPRHRGQLNVVVKDKWEDGCTEQGVCVQCSPSGGRLEAQGAVDVRVQVYADTWGVYCETVLFEVDGVASAERTTVALSVWVEAVGSPVQILLQSEANENTPTIWFTQSEGEEERRPLRIRNVSRAPLFLRTYVLSNNYNETNASAKPRPFRVLINFQDTTPCGCSSRISIQESEHRSEASNASILTYSEVLSSIKEDIGTDIELYLAPDYGHHHEENFKIRPTTLELTGGEVATLEVVRERIRRSATRTQPVVCPGRIAPDDLGKAKCSAPAESAYSRLVAQTSFSLQDSIKARYSLQAENPLHPSAQAELSLQNSAQVDQNSAQAEYSFRNSKQAEYPLRDSMQAEYLMSSAQKQYSQQPFRQSKLSPDNSKQTQYSINTYAHAEHSLQEATQLRSSEQQSASTQFVIRNSIQEEYPLQWPDQAGRTTQAVMLLIEMQPTFTRGKGWARGAAGTLALRLRDSPRSGELFVTPDRITVRLCAAGLPPETAVRVRKRVRIQNRGTGPMDVTARCEAPWTLVTPAPPPVRSPRTALTRSQTARLHLAAGSAIEVRAELSACAADVVPLQSPQPPLLVLNNTLEFLQDQTVLKCVDLQLQLEYPRLLVEPEELSLGVCAVGDSWKEYFTVTHTARSTCLDVVAVWSDYDSGHEIRLHPSRLRLAYAERGIFYVQYAPRSATATKGEVRVWAVNAAWCAASVRVRAQASHDLKFREPAHCRDYTDDLVLEPPPPLSAHRRDYADDVELQPPSSSPEHSTAETASDHAELQLTQPTLYQDYLDDIGLQPPPPGQSRDRVDDDVVLESLLESLLSGGSFPK